VLRPKGLFTFTTLGPDTLKEVRDLWRASIPLRTCIASSTCTTTATPLVRAGFAEPVMDTERLTVTYRDCRAAWRIRGSGAHNIAQGRPRGLTGRARGAVVRSRSEALSSNGPLHISVEVVHGHAWQSASAARGASAQRCSCRSERLRTRRRDQSDD
jgi:malonyl-CoA O-methyltransferase